MPGNVTFNDVAHVFADKAAILPNMRQTVPDIFVCYAPKLMKPEAARPSPHPSESQMNIAKWILNYR